MLLAAATEASTYTFFDVIMLAFTVIIFAGLVRLLLARPRKNKFAIAYTTVALLVFVVADYKMVTGW